MKPLFQSVGIGSVLTLVAVALGCAPSNKVPAGAPVMLGFSVVAADGSPVELETEAGPVAVPPLAHFVATFDRLLDPTGLADVDPDAGTITPIAGIAVINWSGGAIDADAHNTLYTPNGHHQFTLIYPNGPSLTITPQMGLPSGSAVTVALDTQKVRSYDQKNPFVAGDGVNATLSFDTEPLSVTIDVPAPPEPPDGGTGDDGGTDDGGTDDAGTGSGMAPPVDPDFVSHVVFNNLTNDATEMAIQVAGTLAGAPIAALDAVVARDEMDPTGWTVSPPAGGWPAGATVTIAVGTSAADNFAQTLAAAATASFTVKP